MTIAFDALTGSAEGTGTPSATHTPAGTPRGVFVFIGQGTATDVVTGATYGGIALTRLTTAADTAGEACRSYAYFLGTGIPTGAQTFTCTVSGGLHNKRLVCVTVTAAYDTVPAGTAQVVQEDAADPSMTISDLPLGFGSMAFAHLMSGQDAVTSVTETGTVLEEYDFGVRTQYTQRSAVETDGSITLGWTATIDDVAALMVAIREVAPALPLLGVG